MTRNTRQEILDTAKILFNERGYNNVSTGDIAARLGISKGNLTYYFKKKEEIIEAIVGETPDSRPAEPPKTLLELNAYLENIQQVVQSNSFYFWHHSQLAQVSQRIKSLQEKAFEDSKKLLVVTMKTLAEQKMIREEEYENEYHMVIDSLWLTSIYWLPFCELKEARDQAGFLDQAWSVIYPLLTEQGKLELNTFFSF